MKRDYAAAVRRLHDLGVMINGSFVFGMDGDDASVFDRTVEWAIGQACLRHRGSVQATRRVRRTRRPSRDLAAGRGREARGHDLSRPG